MRSKKGRFALALLLVLGLVATSVAVAATRGDGNHHASSIRSVRAPSRIAVCIASPVSPGLAIDHFARFGWSPPYSPRISGLCANPPAASRTPCRARTSVGAPARTSGGVAFFFCGGGGKAACPSSASGPVTISGSVGSGDIVGPTTQGFAANDLTSIVKAIQAGATYANMHTSVYPGGEIRGQLVGGGHDDDQDEND